MKTRIKKSIPLIAALLCVIGLFLVLFPTLFSPVSYLEISPESIYLAPGESVQLTVTGYTKDGEAVSAQKVERMKLIWGFRTASDQSDQQAFSVDENGLLTAHSDGIGNVWVNSKHGGINSRAIIVYVTDPS